MSKITNILWAVVMAAMTLFCVVVTYHMAHPVKEEWVPIPYEDQEDSLFLTHEKPIEPTETAQEEPSYHILSSATLVTYYCCEKRKHICGTGDGICADGSTIEPWYSCAVPTSIPLGSTIQVRFEGEEEWITLKATDRGSWINGNHIDIAVSTHSEALELGTDIAEVRWYN